MLAELRHNLQVAATPERALGSARYFKTGPGQYGEGDTFLGVTVPLQRSIAKQFRTLPLTDTEKLLRSPWHEERLTALFILVDQFKKDQPSQQQIIFELYMCHVGPMAFKLATGQPPRTLKRATGVQYGVNNWDLVDSSAPYISGEWLLQELPEARQQTLISLAGGTVWERRVAILSTFPSLMRDGVTDTFIVADLLANDPHDLLQKAVGWLLREAGKRCGREKLVSYLYPRYKTMPRTMLRYAIEHFPADERRRYLRGEV